MLSIKTTDVIEQTPEGTLCGSEVIITGAYNRLLGEYEALSMCFIDQILKDCEDSDYDRVEFATHFTEITNRVVSHLVKEVKNA